MVVLHKSVTRDMQKEILVKSRLIGSSQFVSLAMTQNIIKQKLVLKPRRQEDTEKHNETPCITVSLCLRGSYSFFVATTVNELTSCSINK
jgi:hypothetical protein